ncbi:hypothetical protein TNCV_2832961 [Trichonephila clavipes]|nr:hypothetical protein TNCV_2832961 [Trichonephila clavipes]
MLSQVLPIHLNRYIATYHTSALTTFKDMDISPVAPLRKRGRPRKVTSTSTQNTHVPSPSTASTAISRRTIHPSTKATTTAANSSDSVSSPGRRRIHLDSSHIKSRETVAHSGGQGNLRNGQVWERMSLDPFQFYANY